jgi:uncharacterized membrane protein
MDDIDIYNSYYWKLGIFYFNPENPKIFVPKRIGIGWTLNFGRWQTFLLLAVLIGAAVFLPFILR